MSSTQCSKLDFRLIYIFTTMVMVNTIYTIDTPFYPILAEEKDIGSWVVGLVFCVEPLMGVLSSSYIGNNLYKLGRRFSYLLGTSLGGLSFCIMATVPYVEYELFIIISFISAICGGLAISITYVTAYSYAAN